MGGNRSDPVRDPSVRADRNVTKREEKEPAGGGGNNREEYAVSNEKVYQMKFSKIYPLLVNKAVRKGRTQEEVDQVICWLTGYTKPQLEEMLKQEIRYLDKLIDELAKGKSMEKILRS